MKKAIIISSIVVSLSLVGFFVVRPAIIKHNIRKRLNEIFNNPDSEDSVGGTDKFLANEAFDIKAFDENYSKATISRLEAREKAKMIWDNYSYLFGSNQSAIVNAFSGLGHVDDVSKIAHEFYESYKEELVGVLDTAMTDKAKKNLLIKKIGNLPKD
ncbi:MAG: hypothetical protein A3D31_11310 [Candidatus Fluviicola riflensis]|nr:MAG: hypothetical protein CHH17_15735 [Candidatus Fluviicola riflensis]OGS77577.1 MAG: hypothetical protein A3D31_11310 [Candidatus Fluviicola riflensis]OGS84158.1 MAG: hypothetical protein A3E30_12710 [Fluviicola sp. RIFCSPHIGHO2_12_FULL_43_24]OGS84643.1 MAG: hypothetical protein A2724_08245 [Fluviicola sp. RIFCSPHIGHO2_01_FULL_43_53]